MKPRLQIGDHVGWNSAAGHVQGTIKKKAMAAINLKGYTVRAPKKGPQYLTKGAPTCPLAAYKGSALNKM